MCQTCMFYIQKSVRSVKVADYGEAFRNIDAFRQSFMVFQLMKIAQILGGMRSISKIKIITILKSIKEA